MAGKRPNVLIFCVDEMRGDHMACAGNTVVKTPNIDSLAGTGTLFRRAYCNNPICMPARATMFTGLLPRDHGLRVNGQSLGRSVPTLPQILANAGYRTHAAGKLHLTPWVPDVTPAEPNTFPECMKYWNEGLIRDFPVPYYGFQSVDFVGGHGGYVYGPYVRWLADKGSDRSLLSPSKALKDPEAKDQCYAMGIPEELHYNRYIADSAIRHIRDDSDAPFFVWCSFPDPHLPAATPAPYCHMYRPADVGLPHRREGETDDLPAVYRSILQGKLKPNGIHNEGLTDDYWQSLLALTYGMITHIDAEIGRVISTLEETGRRDNTIIMFVSDHGDMMGDHGLLWKAFYTFKGCVNIPMIISVPGVRGDGTSDALAAQVDIVPTILDFCGVPMPGSDWVARKTPFERGAILPLNTHPGRSWRPILDGSERSVRNSVVIENDDPVTGYCARALVTRSHRLAVYPGTDDGELFDLRTDPYELHNLWYDDAHRSLKCSMLKQLLDDYSLETPFYPVPPWNA